MHTTAPLRGTRYFATHLIAAIAMLLVSACAVPPQTAVPSAAPTEPVSAIKVDSPVPAEAIAPRATFPAPEAAPLAPPPEQPPAATKEIAAVPAPPFVPERVEIVDTLHGVQTIDRTLPTDDLWQRIRTGFAMPDLSTPLVQPKIDWYLAHPDYLNKLFERSRKYLFYIVEELEKRGMPTELALLPMIESSFNPMAYSRAHASGLWQFIPPTGKRYSLEQNWWYDGRRDVIASTSAALEYLDKLFDMLGDWHLALASYNWGENAVKRAVDKNIAAGLQTDYANLAMPSETRQYVPKLLALKQIIERPAAYGIALEPIPNQPYFATVERPRTIDLHLAARLAELSIDEFVALNPGFNRPLIPSNLQDSHLILPSDKVAVFYANLEKHDDTKLTSWQTYRPKPGESLEAIAQKFKLTVARLKEVNGITRRMRGVPQLLVVPITSAAATLRLPIMYAPPVQPPAPRVLYHIVRKGDTLGAIARRYRVAIADLNRWNPDLNLSIGQRVRLEVRRSAGSVRQKHRPTQTGTKALAQAQAGTTVK